MSIEGAIKPFLKKYSAKTKDSPFVDAEVVKDSSKRSIAKTAKMLFREFQNLTGTRISKTQFKAAEKTAMDRYVAAQVKKHAKSGQKMGKVDIIKNWNNMNKTSKSKLIKAAARASADDRKMYSKVGAIGGMAASSAMSGDDK